MKLLAILLLAVVAAVPVRGLASGAPASSCYDFNITHNGFTVPVLPAIDCDALFQTRCNALEAELLAEVDENRTNITLNPTTYKCGGMYSGKWTRCEDGDDREGGGGGGKEGGGREGGGEVGRGRGREGGGGGVWREEGYGGRKDGKGGERDRRK